ncbi:hypothetical protein [Corynebacterium aurimucosum]|uniref:hypothetical protein n=1 Tax=Corynebacterium aurimucosum TaxID=169292 RepID=UPI0018799038|nr:hypothetical protein [Corynebacterium aurimucosum]MBE7338110.1 hypothetical protein [Corynebacterium aurimucosum]
MHTPLRQLDKRVRVALIIVYFAATAAIIAELIHGDLRAAMACGWIILAVIAVRQAVSANHAWGEEVNAHTGDIIRLYCRLEQARSDLTKGRPTHHST